MSDKRLSVNDLSPDQREVYSAMRTWAGGDGSLSKVASRSFREHQEGDILTVGGYAGSGKTSLLGVFASNCKNLVAYVSYTGRASSILRRKLKAAGCETTRLLRRADEDSSKGGDAFYDDDLEENSGPPLCTTIHSLLYRPIIDPTTEELRGWTKRTKLDRNYSIIVVDEASMVGDDILRDILSHEGVSLMAVGDHGQLPPVMARGDLMKSPMLRLEKIHRQAEKSPIIALSKHLREGGYLGDFPATGSGEVEVLAKHTTNEEIRQAFLGRKPLDVAVLCWMNKTRVKLNQSARTALGIKGPPRKGEPVICLKNKPPVYNGMRGVLTENSHLDGEKPWILHASIAFPDEGIPALDYMLCAPQFHRERTYDSIEELQERGLPVYSMGAAGDLFDFGYACTVHKFQGSQAGHVVLCVDRPEKPHDEDWRKWIYTGVTRAAERLTVIQ